MTDDAITHPEPNSRSAHRLAEMSLDGDRGTERLRGEIQSRLDGFSAKQRRLARFLLENEEQLPFTTAAAVGSAVGASAATVVRFAQLLGYSGFTELRDSVRNGTPPFPTFLQQLSGLSNLQASSPSELMRLVFRYEQENLIGTARSIDLGALERAAATISGANQVILVGAGVGRSVVQLLGGHLARLKTPVVMPADSIDTVIALANAGANDVVLGVSFWRFAKSTSDWLQLARQRDATTIAIVDSPLYPSAGAVDHLLVVRSANPGHGPSTVAAAAIVNLLVSAVILSDFGRYFDAIEHLDRAYAEAQVYLE